MEDLQYRYDKAMAELVASEAKVKELSHKLELYRDAFSEYLNRIEINRSQIQEIRYHLGFFSSMSGPNVVKTLEEMREIYKKNFISAFGKARSCND